MDIKNKWSIGFSVMRRYSLTRHADGFQPSLCTQGRGRQIAMELPAADLQALRAFAQANDCSLFIVLLTAYYSLLWRYTGQEDIVVGTPVALRRQADIETMVGVFINTLPLRVDPKPEESFRHFLSRVKRPSWRLLTTRMSILNPWSKP